MSVCMLFMVEHICVACVSRPFYPRCTPRSVLASAVPAQNVSHINVNDENDFVYVWAASVLALSELLKHIRSKGIATQYQCSVVVVTPYWCCV